MNVLLVSQYYSPESGAGANRATRLARAWKAQGHQVTVLTTFPHYPEGKIYPGYRNGWVSTESIDGVRVVRVPTYISRNAGVWRRSLSFASFFLSAIVFGFWNTRSAQVVVASSPQLLVGLAGAILSVAHGKPLVLDVRDLWPDSITAVGALREGSLPIRLLRRIELWIYRRASFVASVSRAFMPILESRGVDRANMEFLPNTLDDELFHPEAQPGDPIGDDDLWPGRFVICFAGTVGMAHGLGTLLDAARLLRDESEYLFLVVGDGAERKSLEERAKSEGLENVVFTGRVPRHRVAGFLRRADASLILLRDDPLFKTVLPSKLFESLGTGTPILLGVDGEARRLVEEAGAGLFFPTSEPLALVHAIRSLSRDPDVRRRMGESGRAYVRLHFDREVVTSKYAAVLERLTARDAKVETTLERN